MVTGQLARRRQFVALSAALTGDDSLPPDVAGAGAYLARLDRARPGGIDRLLLAVGDAIDSSDPAAVAAAVAASPITSDDELWAVATDLITVWMNSRIPSVDAIEPEEVPAEQYYRGRIWSTIKAHPLGMSGGYFGYWHYAPEARP